MTTNILLHNQLLKYKTPSIPTKIWCDFFTEKTQKGFIWWLMGQGLKLILKFSLTKNLIRLNSDL